MVLWFDVVPSMDTKKTHVLVRDWTVCLDYEIRSKLNNRPDFMDAYDYITNKRFSHFDNEQDIRTSSINYKESDYGLGRRHF